MDVAESDEMLARKRLMLMTDVIALTLVSWAGPVGGSSLVGLRRGKCRLLLPPRRGGLRVEVVA